VSTSIKGKPVEAAEMRRLSVATEIHPKECDVELRPFMDELGRAQDM
jgi:hypothetical protein